MIWQLSRLWRTIRHLRFSQIAYRIRYRVRDRFWPSSPPDLSLPETPLLLRNQLRESERRDAWRGNTTFCFLNRCVDTHGRWDPPGTDRLWQFNLHYFDYLFECNADDFQQLITHWIHAVSRKNKVAWHAYPMSLRLCNWVWNYSRLEPQLPDTFKAIFLASAARQLSTLTRLLEWDICANHLFENIKACLITGLFLKQDRMVDHAIRLLKDQLAEQFLTDGGHYERSPMYHVVMLEGIIMVYEALQAAGRDPTFLTRYIENATRFLATLAYQNTFPAFNDACEGVTYRPDTVIGYVQTKMNMTVPPPKSTLLPSSGYYVHRSARAYWVMDVGAIGPDHQLGHAHNDMLSLILWLDGMPVLTDAGIYDYESDKPLVWRPYFRSTRAHNTVIIDNTEQNETWGAFRVGRRGYPCEVHEIPDGIRAGQTGYSHLGVIVHREVSAEPSGIRICEMLTAQKGRHAFEANLHFAPGIQLEIGSHDPNTHTYLLRDAKNRYQLTLLDPGITITPCQSWYSAEFGLKTQRLALRLSGTFTGTYTFRYRVGILD